MPLFSRRLTPVGPACGIQAAGASPFGMRVSRLGGRRRTQGVSGPPLLCDHLQKWLFMSGRREDGLRVCSSKVAAEVDAAAITGGGRFYLFWMNAKPRKLHVLNTHSVESLIVR